MSNPTRTRDEEVLRLRASLRSFARDWPGVVADLEAVVASNPSAALGGQLAGAYRSSGDGAAALAEYDRELGLAPGDPVLLGLRARLRRARGDARGAREDLAAAIRDGGDAQLLRELADVEAELGLLDAALRHLDDAVRKSSHWPSLLARGAFKLRLERWEEAEIDLDAVIFELADAPACQGFLQETLRYRGWAKLFQGKRDALDDLSAALRLNPRDAEALCLRGGLRAAQGDPKAREDLDEALRLDPSLALAHAFRGDVLLTSGDTRAAGAEYLKAIELNPSLRETLSPKLEQFPG